MNEALYVIHITAMALIQWFIAYTTQCQAVKKINLGLMIEHPSPMIVAD
jgi:phosphoenolpyruvate-protein kinase (PTS system EI component)